MGCSGPPPIVSRIAPRKTGKFFTFHFLTFQVFTFLHRLSFPFFFDPHFSAVVEPIGRIARDSRLQEEGYVRWDGATVADFHGTYGEYILRKVMKVFPDLSSSQNVEYTIKALTAKIKEAMSSATSSP